MTVSEEKSKLGDGVLSKSNIKEVTQPNGAGLAAQTFSAILEKTQEQASNLMPPTSNKEDTSFWSRATRSPRRMQTLLEQPSGQGYEPRRPPRHRRRREIPGILRPDEPHVQYGRCCHPDPEDDAVSPTTISTDQLTALPRQRNRKNHQRCPNQQSHGPQPRAWPVDNSKPSVTLEFLRDSCEFSDKLSRTSIGEDISPYQDDPRPSASCTVGDATPLWPTVSPTARKGSITPLSALIRGRQGSAPPPYPASLRKGSNSTIDRRNMSPTLANDHVIQVAADYQDVAEKNLYLLKLCKAYLLCGSPAHRMEEYLHQTAYRLGVTAEFQYLPNSMLMVLSNPAWQMNEIHLVREKIGLDLGKIEDTFNVYEAVVRSKHNLRICTRELDTIIARKPAYSASLLVPLHGLAAVCAGTFAFGARPVDFGPLFVLGCTLAIMQLLVFHTSFHNSHVLEVATSVVVSFAARGLGSIYNQGQPVFCFSAITQGCIALILPGHLILAATHELQNRQLISGAVKMVYAIIYTLFLGFGILLGTTLFGLIDHNASSEMTCRTPDYWNPNIKRWHALYAQFVWIPPFTVAIALMHQAKKNRVVAMVFIATCGHQAFYWSSVRFAQNLQISSAIASFTAGSLANLYSPVCKCIAASVLMPAILVQVPNALAASNSLVAGVGTADSIMLNKPANATALLAAHLLTRDVDAIGASGSTGSILTSGYGMAQATIGLTVGLFLSALVIYPFAKKRAGFFSF